MSIGGELKRLASEIARDVEAQKPSLEAELAKIEAQKTAVEAKLRAASLGPERTYNFQPEIDGQLQCPRCFIAGELQSPLFPIPSQTKEDNFSCRTCHFKFTI